MGGKETKTDHSSWKKKFFFFFFVFLDQHSDWMNREVWKRGVDAGAAKAAAADDVQVDTSVHDAVMAYLSLNASAATLSGATDAGASRGGTSSSLPVERAPIRHPNQGVGAMRKKNNAEERTKAQKMLMRPTMQRNTEDNDGGSGKQRQRGKKRQRKRESSSEEEEDHDVGKSGLVK